MNEPLFENVFIRDESILKEFYKHSYISSKRFKIMCIGYALLILGSLLSLNLYFLTMYCILGIVLGLVILFSYHQSLKMIIARNKETANGKEMLVKLVVYEDRIEHSLIESVNTLYLENIKRVEQTKNCYAIITKANQAYIFKKDAFTLGTSGEFIEFLKSKGIKIQK